MTIWCRMSWVAKFNRLYILSIIFNTLARILVSITSALPLLSAAPIFRTFNTFHTLCITSKLAHTQITGSTPA